MQLPIAPLLLFALARLGALASPLCREVHGSSSPWRNCTIQIGGLAIRGPEAFGTQFNATFQDFLTQRLGPEYGLEFQAIPLNFDQNFEYVTHQRLDFIYSNPAAYTCLMVEFSVVTIASMVNLRRGNALERFAGVIFARNGSNFTTVEDLRRARVEAVSISGLGAMQLQQAELLELGLDVMTDVKRLTFAYSQDKIVQDVESGYTDVGFVRTDMIDRSVAAGKTRWEYFHVINEIQDPSFPFKRSTAFTPEWPIGGLEHVPHEIMQLVAVSLWALDAASTDPALSTPSVSGKFATWVPPMNYLALLGMLEKIGYYNPADRVCLRSKDVYVAINCPSGYVKQSQEMAFCANDCRSGYTCLCQPCTKLSEPELVLSVEGLNTSWSDAVDTALLGPLTHFEPQCARMGTCLQVATGQRVRWTLLDQIGRASRLQINAPVLANVEIFLQSDAQWQPMAMENTTLPSGLPTEKYTFDDTARATGTQIVQIRVNGEQAAMSPVVTVHVEPPKRAIICTLGEKAEEDGSCTACPPGRFGTVEGQGRDVVYGCQPCLRGMYQPNASQSECLLCSSGRVAPSEAALLCELCAAGKSTLGREGRAQCEACEPGQKAPEQGQARCSPCERGRYSPTEGSLSCWLCDGGMTTKELGAQNASACGCSEGSYMAVATGGARCRACLRPGTHCPGFGSPPLLEEGFFMFDSSPRDAENLDVYKCGSEIACKGQTSPDCAVCAENRFGLNCARCASGFQGSMDGSTCEPCNDHSKWSIPLLFVSMLPLFGLLHYFWNHGRAGQLDAVEGVLGSLAAGTALLFLQSLGLLDGMTLAFPGVFPDFLKHLKIFFFDISGLEVSCIFETSLMSAYGMSLAIPVAACLVIANLWWLSRLLHVVSRGCVPKFAWEDLFNTAGLVVMALYISVCCSVLSLVDCYSGPNGQPVVRSMPFAVCSGDEYERALPLFALGVAVYFILITASMMYTLYLVPTKFSHTRFRASVRFLIYKFRPKVWWFSLFMNLRSFALAMVTVAFPDDMRHQVIAMILILLLSLCVHEHYLPYSEGYANKLETFELVGLITIIVVGTMGSDDEENQTSYGITLVILVALVLGVCLVVAAWAMFLASKPSFAKSRHRSLAVSQKDHFRQACELVVQASDDLVEELFLTATELDLSQAQSFADFVILHLTGNQPRRTSRRMASKQLEKSLSERSTDADVDAKGPTKLADDDAVAIEWPASRWRTGMSERRGASMPHII